MKCATGKPDLESIFLAKSWQAATFSKTSQEADVIESEGIGGEQYEIGRQSRFSWFRCFGAEGR